MSNTTTRSVSDITGTVKELPRQDTLIEGQYTLEQYYAMVGLVAPTTDQSIAGGSGQRYSSTDLMPSKEDTLMVIGQTRNG